MYDQSVIFTGLVDWTGLDWTQPKICKMHFSVEDRSWHTYLFTKIKIACFPAFPRVGRGQTSRAINELQCEEHLHCVFTAEIELQPFAEA